MPSFTSQIPNLQSVGPIVELEVSVSQAAEEVLRGRGAAVPAPLKTIALIDTGASVTVIQSGMAKQLGLNAVGVKLISTPSSTNIRCFEYEIMVMFPNNVLVAATAIEAPLQGQHIQCLIGRDVLAHGVLVYIGYTNSFTLSF